MTTTSSTVAVPVVAEAGALEGGEADGVMFCAVAMFAAKDSAANAIRNCFIMIFAKWIFKIGIGSGVHDLCEAM